MSNDMNKTVREFYKAVEGVKNKKPLGYDTQATVRRIEDGVAWVHIPDGVDETPARMTISAKVGDVVQVRIVNGRAFLVGNASAPPTDNTEAVKAMGQAGLAAEAASIARQKADEAVEDAATAHEAAMNAQDSAYAAQTAAENAQRDADDVAENLKSVVAGATTVEKAVSVMQTALEAVVDYDPTTDTTKEYFWHDANGAHVLGTDSGYRNDVDSSGMKIVEVSTEDTVAEFGADGAQIGKSNTSNIQLDYNSIQFFDRDGTVFFEAEDLRDADGVATVEETDISNANYVEIDGVYYRYITVALEVDELVSVAASDLPTIPKTDISLDSCLADYQVVYIRKSVLDQYTYNNESYVNVVYKTTSDKAKTYTLGTRSSGVRKGACSVAEGYNTEASEYTAHAEGCDTVASGLYSHAQGRDTVASGYVSHAGGEGTRAKYWRQTVIGRYNSNKSNSVFEIGNGTSDSARSNALTVDWSGNVTAADFVAGSMTLATLFNTSKMSQPSIYQSRLDNMTLYHYTIGRMCFVHGIFRLAVAGWADMAVTTGFPTPAFNTSAPLTAANPDSSSHDPVVCYINPQGSLCIHSVLAQYTWVTVSGYYQRNL